MNPCPCGYYGDPVMPCTCSSSTVTKYQKRISSPLLDRIDIHIEVPRVEYDKLSAKRLGEPSAVIQARVEAARALMKAAMSVQATHALNLSARAYHCMLKLSRTIADLAGSETIASQHLAEALQFRPRLMESG